LFLSEIERKQTEEQPSGSLTSGTTFLFRSEGLLQRRPEIGKLFPGERETARKMESRAVSPSPFPFLLTPLMKGNGNTSVLCLYFKGKKLRDSRTEMCSQNLDEGDMLMIRASVSFLFH
jgi:hypothetical protein